MTADKCSKQATFFQFLIFLLLTCFSGFSNLPIVLEIGKRETCANWACMGCMRNLSASSTARSIGGGGGGGLVASCQQNRVCK